MGLEPDEVAAGLGSWVDGQHQYEMLSAAARDEVRAARRGGPVSGSYDGPRIGDLVVVHGPLCRVVELAVRDDVAGAVITDDHLQAWAPLEWLVRVHLRGNGERAMSAEYEQPAVVEGELVDLDALPQEKPLQYPPAVREARHITTHRRTCARGKGSPEADGAIGGRRPFSCGEILEIAARVGAGRRPAARWRWLLPVHGRHVAHGGHGGRRWP